MKTVGAKEFRLNMNKLLDEALAGQEIIIQHRFKQPVRLTRDDSARQGNGASLAQVLRDLRPRIDQHQASLSAKKSLKALYRESMAKKYGVN